MNNNEMREYYTVTTIQWTNDNGDYKRVTRLATYNYEEANKAFTNLKLKDKHARIERNYDQGWTKYSALSLRA